MYEAYYGFVEKPFNLTPDPKYLYLSRRHAEAFAHLEFGRRERGGFILITGEVGTGKTTLARYFLGRLPENTATAVVLYPALTAAELLRSILEDLHVPAPGTSLKELVDTLHRFLLDSRPRGREVVLLIDEAQDLSAEVLEQIRLISNLETDTEKLIQIVLMGQSELQELLARRELRQLAQRVTARYHLSPLSRPETEEYVRHRLSVAGGTGKVTFTPAALRAVHRRAAGIPRLINLICDRSLLAGFVSGTRVIEAGMVRRAADEVKGDGPAPWLPSRAYALLAGGVAVALALVVTLAAPRTLRAPEPEAPPTAPAAVSRLEPALLAIPHDASREAALSQVQAQWGNEPLERTSLRTHLDQVRHLDLPVILEMFHPSRRDTCFLALLGLEGGTALVAVGTDSPFRVGVADLDRLWTHEAIFLWRDFQGLVRPEGRARTEAWAKDSLARLGYAGSEADLSTVVGRFQRDSALIADGVIGSRTLMTLYSLGPYTRPRLKASVPRPGGAS
ncbi:MAG TPA: AAA family ATPase [Vicinamibacteria bacterium]|nr:AAA family ATPase [Vicinamibacteria bacterium]